MTVEDFLRLKTIFGDNKYRNHSLTNCMEAERPDWQIKVESPPEGTGFSVVAKRWVVERTNAWNGRSRRCSKDYERLVESSAAMIELANIHIMLRRLAPPKVGRPEFQYGRASDSKQTTIIT